MLENEHEYDITVDCPGVTHAGLDIHVHSNGRLDIKTNRESRIVDDVIGAEGNWTAHFAEREKTSSFRSLQLPPDAGKRRSPPPPSNPRLLTHHTFT